MSADVITPIAGFVDASEVQAQLGCSRWTWRVLLQESGAVLYRHPGNGRKRLLREADAARLLTPQPAKPQARRRQRTSAAA
jgi:hypothetical protein